MSITKTLLYPFSIDRPYFESYAWAIELAQRMQAKLFLFTTTGTPSLTPSAADPIYHSLLEAQGYYLQHYQPNGHKQADITKEPCITAGELEHELVAHLRKNPVDIVILDSQFALAHATGLSQIVKESAGVIVLPKSNQSSKWVGVADHFYDDLRRAKLYKLPTNFFSTLGTDHSAFNYLRKFFQKN
jgi:hypothetical protein